MNRPHIPVLVSEIVSTLDPQAGDRYLDLTAGYGGHALAMLKHQPDLDVTLVDRDDRAVKHLSQSVKDARIIHQDFANFCKQAISQEAVYDVVLADIGVSSPHVDNADRGFSFNKRADLDMRMDTSQQLTAHEVVNSYSEDRLVQIFRVYGEERQATRYAKLIVNSRPLQTTTELAELISNNSRYSKTHPATKIFQAIRIEVNDELGQLKTLLELGPRLLSNGGRLGIISFHSLEDRLVKQRFLVIGQDTLDSDYRTLTKKPIVPSPNELAFNPRARSAKLRVLQRKQK